ncbi:histidine phosphatase family protein [Acidaminococcus intestini]|jgi:broad specificity phosphatase PhoE|uniref:histidine phosphatase family protein n=1 Tax=Acidaminococcus intestini TaxID=187327 RepID=UPI003C6C1EB6
MKTIYLVRHGRTRSNEEGRFQGWEDHPLSPVGQEQALSLKNEPVTLWLRPFIHPIL